MDTMQFAKTLYRHHKHPYYEVLRLLPVKALETISQDVVDALKRRDDAGLDRPDYVAALAMKYVEEITAAHTVNDPVQLQQDIEAVCDFVFDQVKEALGAWVDELIAAKQAKEDAV